MKKMTFFALSASSLICAAVLSACASPHPEDSVLVPIDGPDSVGGIGSGDIRNVASQMCPQILNVPEIAGAATPSIVKVSDFKNKSRFFIDSNMFMTRLTGELNQFSGGRVRFLNKDQTVNVDRAVALKDRQSKQIEAALDTIAKEIAASPVLNQAEPVKIAVLPVFNTNLVDMNADSFTAMLRSKVVNASAGKARFLMPNVTEGADYYLTGQFIPESITTEGVINYANYIEVVNNRVKQGLPMAIPVGEVASSSLSAFHVEQRVVAYEDYLKKLLESQSMQQIPNVNKRLNVILADSKDKASVYEKMLMIDNKMTDNSGAANYIISGEISSLSKRVNGKMLDYILITVQLSDVDSNMVIFQGTYEVKYASQLGTVYQ